MLSREGSIIKLATLDDDEVDAEDCFAAVHTTCCSGVTTILDGDQYDLPCR